MTLRERNGAAPKLAFVRRRGSCNARRLLKKAGARRGLDKKIASGSASQKEGFTWAVGPITPPLAQPLPRRSPPPVRSKTRAPRLLSSSLVRFANIEVGVLEALFDLGPTSRAELARKAGVNRTTISGIVQALIDRRI